MKRDFHYILLLLIAPMLTAMGQEQSDDVILKAMQDELTRNMKELKLPDYDKPFLSCMGYRTKKVTPLLPRWVPLCVRPKSLSL